MIHPPEPESKFRETLRYTGYAIGMVGGLIIAAIVLFFMDIIVDEIISWFIDYFLILLLIIFIAGLVISAYYVIFKRDR